MDNNIPSGAWIILFIFIIFIFSFNLWLWTAYKKKGNDKFINKVQDMGRRIKNPWQDEENKFTELNIKVKELTDAEHKDKSDEYSDNES